MTRGAGDAPLGIGSSGCEQHHPGDPLPGSWGSLGWAVPPLLAQLETPPRLASHTSFGSCSPAADPAGTEATVGSSGFVHTLPTFRVLYLCESSHSTDTLGFPCAQEVLVSFPRQASVPRAADSSSSVGERWARAAQPRGQGLLRRDSWALQSQKLAENHGAGSNLAHS